MADQAPGAAGGDADLDTRVGRLERKVQALEKALAHSASVAVVSSSALLRLATEMQTASAGLVHSPATIQTLKDLRERLVDLTTILEEVVDVG